MNTCCRASRALDTIFQLLGKANAIITNIDPSSSPSDFSFQNTISYIKEYPFVQLWPAVQVAFLPKVSPPAYLLLGWEGRKSKTSCCTRIMHQKYKTNHTINTNLATNTMHCSAWASRKKGVLIQANLSTFTKLEL